MRRKGLSKQRKLRLSLISSLFVVFTIPFVVFALLSSTSFDTSSKASVDGTSLNCSFEFVYVNPSTIKADSTLQLNLLGSVLNDGELIQSIELNDIGGTPVFSKKYDLDISSVSESFSYTSGTEPSKSTIVGTLTSNQTTYPCVLYGTQNNNIEVLQSNLAPDFLTQPETSATPSNVLDVGDSYRYVLKAVDPENDKIEYHYSFTPGANWLNMNEVINGTGGNLELNFTGVPEIPESYLANVFIHDGYSQNLRSQTWVISVEQPENDIPVVTITQPGLNGRASRGDVVTISWQATDLNQIVGYRLYYATNPGNESTWVPINTDIAYDIGNYLFDTSSMEPGVYKFIVQAIDNQSPALVGTGISNDFTLDRPVIVDPDPNDPTVPIDEPDKPDDGVRLEEPQIINVSPEPGSEVSNARRTISATIIASKNAELNNDDISMSLNGTDISDKLEISEISDHEVTIIYKPDEDLAEGEHKVEVRVEDTEGKTGNRAWTFTLNTEGEDGDTYNIFGYDIPKRTAIIIGAGIGIILLALLIPWLLYLAWRNNDEDEYDLYSTNDTYTTQYNPPSTSTYTSTNSVQPTYGSVSTTTRTENVETKTPMLHPKTNVETSKTTTTNNNTYTTPSVSAPMPANKYTTNSNTTEKTVVKPYEYPSVGSNTTSSSTSNTTTTKTNEVILPAAKPVPPTTTPATNPIAYPPKASVNLSEAKPVQKETNRDDFADLAQSLKAESDPRPQATEPTVKVENKNTTTSTTFRQQPVGIQPVQQSSQIPKFTPTQPIPKSVQQQPVITAPKPVTQPAPQAPSITINQTNTTPANVPPTKPAPKTLSKSALKVEPQNK